MAAKADAQAEIDRAPCEVSHPVREFTRRYDECTQHVCAGAFARTHRTTKFLRGELTVNGTWLVTGSGGLLGQDVLTGLREAGETATGLDHKALDITDAHAVREVMAKHRPAIVVNCAAFAAPDKAENDEEGALRINGGGARILATACAEFEARLIHVSTDYVFAGDDSGGVAVPFAEDAPTCPVNAYGRTKVAGERAVLECLPETGYVFRTAWLFGAGRTNFVRTMIRLERERDQVEPPAAPLCAAAHRAAARCASS
ncbi:sugar nucleotide-binding protein [Streptomyces sp. NPDC005904]|uniref:SDR family oxidoreductase n=1 Tax=Streptomyces sp. NPDC005904 TaxID=3154570 RepID=UPI0033F1941D